MKNLRTLRRRRGATLAEVVLASSISSIVLFAGVGVFLTGMRSWMGGQAGIDSINSSQRALRVVANELREAMTLTVSGDGKTVTFVKPMKDGSGSYVTPLQADGYTRTVAVDEAGTLTLTAQGASRTLCKNLTSTDAGTAYRYFSPSAGSLTRSLEIKFISVKTGAQGSPKYSRAREILYLRNVPVLSR